MKWLLQRMAYEIEDIDSLSSACEKIIDKYAKMAEIQAKVEYGSVYTIEDFIKSVESRGFIPYDGCGYYWDELRNTETDEAPFNVDELRKASEYIHYVIWYNR